MKIELDGVSILLEQDFHDALASALNLSGYYGCNLSALWDVLSVDVERPVRLLWRNSAASHAAMGAGFERLVDVLRRVERQDIDCMGQVLLSEIVPEAGEVLPVFFDRDQYPSEGELAEFIWKPPMAEINGWDSHPSELMHSYLIVGSASKPKVSAIANQPAAMHDDLGRGRAENLNAEGDVARRENSRGRGPFRRSRRQLLRCRMRLLPG